MSVGGDCDVEKTKLLVKDKIPSSELKSSATGELIFRLPSLESKNFGMLFESLETRKSQLDIGNFGLSITTMEDVFLR